MKSVEICMTIPLRDYAAFEDLAEQLGVEIKVNRLTEAGEPTPAAKKKYAVTEELKQWVQENKNRHDWTLAQYRENCPFKTSTTTLSRLLKHYRSTNGTATH